MHAVYKWKAMAASKSAFTSNPIGLWCGIMLASVFSAVIQSRILLEILGIFVIFARGRWIQNVGCESTGQIWMRQKVVVLRELQRAIIYTTR